jgi:hypothetical protein
VVDAVHVQKITGIAVGDSRYCKTAFPAAGLVAQLQAFDIQGDDQNKGGGKMEMTIEQIKAFLKNGNHQPSTVFDKQTLLSDDLVGDHVKSKILPEYAMRKQAEDALALVQKEMPAKITKLEAENKTLRQTVASGKAQQLVKALVIERKMPEKKAKFIDLKIPEFALEGDAIDDAALKAQVAKFVDAKLDELTQYEAILNPAPSGDNGKGNATHKEDGQKADPELLARQV